MTHIVISDYPYFTTKKFFENLEDAMIYGPNENKLLNARIYTLSSYRDISGNINYGADIQSKIDK